MGISAMADVKPDCFSSWKTASSSSRRIPMSSDSQHQASAEQCLYLKALLTSERITMGHLHILLLKCIWFKLSSPSPPLIFACISPLIIELLVTPWAVSRGSTYQWNNPLQLRVEIISEPIASVNYNSSKNSIGELLELIGLNMPISQNQKGLKLCTFKTQEQVCYKCH